MNTILIALSVVFALISPVTYSVSILRGKTRPHRTTRFVLAGVMLLSFVSVAAAHASAATTILAGIFALHGVVIAALSIRRGMGGTERLDWVCVFIALCGILGWKLSGNAVVSVWFSVLADAAAFVPAVRKTWLQPHTESHWFYTTSLIATALNLAAAKWGPTAIFQLYIIAIDAVLIFCIYRRELMRTVGLAKRG